MRPTSRLRLLLAAGALLVTGLPAAAGTASAAPSAAPVLRADYRLQDVRTSSVPGAPVLGDVGGKTTFATQPVQGGPRRVLTFPEDVGVRVRPTTAVPRDGYSVVLLVRFASVSGYVRVVDVKAGSSDTGLYVYNGYLNFFNLHTGPRPVVKAGAWNQIVLTRSAGTRVVTGYVNGTKQFSFTDSGSLGVVDSSRTFTFFRDNTRNGSTGEASSGAVARIRLYDGALTASQVKALDRLPS